MWLGKRVFDFALALLGLVLLWPIFLMIVILIYLTDRGSVFFRQNRVGYKGENFQIVKFRTMIPDTDKKHILITAANDRRVTRIGKILRATKLDELPQLFNVLKGEMSLVGPRPEVQKYVDLIPLADKNNLLLMRPGITDMASIEFYNEASLLGSSDNPEQMYIESILPQKVKLSLNYATEASFRTDVKIIFKTLKRIF